MLVDSKPPMDNQISLEVDWVNAFYSMMEIWDATFNFWLTVTFAIIVAVNVLGFGVTEKLRWLILTLYSLFSLFVLSRSVAISQQSQYIESRLAELGIDLVPEDYFPSTIFLTDLLLLILFLVGTIGTLVFVYTSGRSDD